MYVYIYIHIISKFITSQTVEPEDNIDHDSAASNSYEEKLSL